MSKEAFAEALAQPFLSAVSNSSVVITIAGVPTSSGAIVNFITLTDNAPKTNGNHIYVWETTSNAVPWDKSPAGDKALDTNSSQASTKVDFDFEDKGYIVGYAVAATPQAVVSTIYIPPDKQDDPTAWKYAQVGINVTYYGNGLVQAQYTGLTQYSPATNKNWIGIWQGANVPYSGDPLKRVNVTQNTPSGYATIEGVKLLIREPYAVGYFMVDPAKGRTSLAAQSTFTVGQK